MISEELECFTEMFFKFLNKILNINGLTITYKVISNLLGGSVIRVSLGLKHHF